MSAHLCPTGAHVRRREAAYLAVQAVPAKLTLLTGDFNSASPRDPEPEGFAALPAPDRSRYLADDLRTADRSVLAHLEAAGWVDVGYALGKSNTPTVPTAAFPHAEFPLMRCDYLLASQALAAQSVHPPPTWRRITTQCWPPSNCPNNRAEAVARQTCAKGTSKNLKEER